MFHIISLVTFLCIQQHVCSSNEQKGNFTHNIVFLEFKLTETRASLYKLIYNSGKNLVSVPESHRLTNNLTLTKCIYGWYWMKKKDEEVKGMLEGLMDNIGKVLPEEEWCNTRVLSYTEEVFTTVPKSHLSDLANYMTTFLYCKGFCVEGTRPLAPTNIRSQLVMGWLALNYALGRGEVEAKNSVAAALLVEKARALVFVPPKLTGKECGCPFMDIGLPFKIYAFSDAIGKNKIRRSIVLSSTDVKECEETKASCLRPLSLKVYSNRTEFLSKEPTIDYKKCKNAIETLVRNYNKPMSFQGRKFYALYSYCEFAIRANLIGENGGSVPLAQIEKKAKQICENNNDDDFLCMDLIYMYVLFKQNYGLKDRCEVHFYKEVNGFELNWRIAKAFSLYKEYNIA